MTKFYENAEGKLFVDPIVKNHTGLTKITKAQFESKLAIQNEPAPLTPDQVRDQALSDMSFDFGNGRIMQVRQADLTLLEESQGQGITHWKMKDNKRWPITDAEMQAALEDGRSQFKVIWIAHLAALPEGGA